MLDTVSGPPAGRYDFVRLCPVRDNETQHPLIGTQACYCISRPLVCVQRIAHQPPQARRIRKRQNANDLAREVVGCMRVLARSWARPYACEAYSLFTMLR
jgi:hypothetical protein